MNIWEALKVTGKARFKTWPENHFITNEITKDYASGGFRNDMGGITYFNLDRKMSDDWEPYIEPCKHDPGYEGDLAVEILCKHCGVKLRATGWEEDK